MFADTNSLVGTFFAAYNSADDDGSEAYNSTDDDGSEDGGRSSTITTYQYQLVTPTNHRYSFLSFYRHNVPCYLVSPPVMAVKLQADYSTPILGVD